MTNNIEHGNSKMVTAFLPCRAGSERVVKKNIRPFGTFSFGLTEIKLKQLVSCEDISKVVLSTNDDEIIEYASGLKQDKLVIHKRDASLASSTTSTDSVIRHAAELIGEGHILWTHVTSPFVGGEIYAQLISAYFDAINGGYDSLMTTTPLHGFLWDSSGPVNYDRTIEKWPRTQTLHPIHEVNSAAFITAATTYRDINDRIGNRPLLYPLDRITAMDIDWEDDFLLAEQVQLLKMRGVW